MSPLEPQISDLTFKYQLYIQVEMQALKSYSGNLIIQIA